MLTLLLATFAASSFAATGECDGQKVASYVAELRVAQRELSDSSYGEDSARKFFRAMPESFSCFNEVFGYPRGTPGPLYFEPLLHPLFPQMVAAVPRAEFAHKLV